jgi:hypothetical protein
MPQYYLSTTKPPSMDGFVARMSNADRRRSGLGLPSNNMSTTSNNLLESYKHVPLRDRSAHALTEGHYNPGSRLTGHPLAPFITAPQLPTALNDKGTAQEPSPIRGPKAPLVLATSRSTTNMGRATDLSARTVDSCLLTCH